MGTEPTVQMEGTFWEGWIGKDLLPWLVMLFCVFVCSSSVPKVLCFSFFNLKCTNFGSEGKHNEMS